MSSTDEKDLIEILELLYESFKGIDNKKKKEVNEKLASKFKDIKRGIFLLFQALSLREINQKEIPIELYDSIMIYLKNILSAKEEELDSKDIFSYLQIFLNIILDPNKINPKLNNSKIFNFTQIIINNLCSSSKFISDENNINKVFQILLDSINSSSNENFLQISKSVIISCSSLLTSKSAQNNNYIDLTNKYYIPIINIIFRNVSKYIDPKNNSYNNDFICVLKHLYEGFYTNLLKMKSILDTGERKEIASKFFSEYGTYSYELLRIVPPFNENTSKKYGKENPIIIFNIDEKKCYEINFMKSKIFQFLSFIIQISTLEDKNTDEEIKNYITDNDLVKLINDSIVLIVNSFEDILNNQNKYIFIRRYNELSNSEDDCFNMLLFTMCVFLTRSLIREPIRTDFSKHIKKFLLNVLFPMIITIDDEINFIEVDPDGYHLYLIDITSEFKIKNFRTSACYLVYKIAEKFEDMTNFILSFNIEMLNYIINEGNIKNEMSEYNIYLKYINDGLINKFSDKIKLDLALLIILILKNHLIRNKYFMNRFRNIFINNQEKLHSIESPIIKIKICKIYNYFLPVFFGFDNKISEKIKINFIENAINFLLNNLIQKKLEKENNYIQSLAQEASDTIIELLNLPRNIGHDLLLKYISESLEKNFSIFNKLIEIVDVYSFYLVIEQIISEIKINQRNLLFECLNNLSIRFHKEFLKNNQESKIFCNHFFIILKSFLTGKNKLNISDKQEISKFNEIFEPILNYIKNPKKFDLYDEIIITTEEYIKALSGINKLSATVLKSIGDILELEKSTSSSCYSFTSIFLSNINNTIGDEPLDKAELFNIIIIIIQKSFSFKNETFEYSDLYALLLTFQIMSLDPNLKEDILSFLLNHSFDCFQKVEQDNPFSNDITNKNMLSLGIISLGFIFKPEIVLKILNNNYSTINDTRISKFDAFINYIYYSLEISFPDYNPILGKCIILGICGILNDKYCIDYLNSNKQRKLTLLKIFILFLINHKKEKDIILDKLMKKETKCNFVEEEENEDEEIEEEFDTDFNEKIENALSGGNKIINSDEFKYFSQVIKFLKEKDPQIYDELINKIFKGIKNTIANLTKMRNIKIKYNGKEIIVPRRTVRIKRKSQ